VQSSETSPHAELRIGDLVPHFEARAIDATLVRYREIWQRRNLVLVSLPPSGYDEYFETIRSRAHEFDERDTELVITRDEIAGLPTPSVIVADRWGEIVHVQCGREAPLPSADALLEWVAHVQHKCPECEGETR
jgi:peroxiredoxin